MNEANDSSGTDRAGGGTRESSADHDEWFGAHYARMLLSTWDDASARPVSFLRRAGPVARTWSEASIASGLGVLVEGGRDVSVPARVADCADGATVALGLKELKGSALLAERAAFLGLGSAGKTSANGTCHLLRADHEYIAVNLAREEDAALLPAWLQVPSATPANLTKTVSGRSARKLTARGRLLGLPVARLGEIQPHHWCHTTRIGAGERSQRGSPLVVDLSGLWAGPLCGHLLGHKGARVIKVESAERPDASREGTPAFYDRLNAGKDSVVLDLPRAAAVARLKALLVAADIVIESSRPRALRQMGIDPEAIAAANPGVTWVSITGYGRGDGTDAFDRDTGLWVAFGDDAAAAGGLFVRTASGPCFFGDAIADPLTGMHAAVAALQSHAAGGGRLIDIALARVAAFCRACTPFTEPGTDVPGSLCEPPTVAGIASRRGADTDRVLAEFCK